ncbi:MAG: ABC transporter permease [Solirubrobacterales bacterium]|jgi:ribose transport system permease protein|nr:ABC transporter permease [Solirubrobacterales bacterium]
MSGSDAAAVSARPHGGRPDVDAPDRADRLARLLQRNGALMVLVVVVVVGALAFDTFGTAENLKNIAINNAFLALVGFGMTFVIISGGIDLSVGSVFALGGVLAGWGAQHGLLAALLAPLIVCTLIGLVQGLLIARLGLAAFIVTLAGLLGARGLLLAITDEGSKTYLIDRDSAFAALGQGEVLGIRVPILIALAALAAGVVVLRRTRFGQTLFAIGGSESASLLMGLPVRRSKTLVYAISGLLAGLAGALLAARTSSGVPTVGVGLELDAIAAVVIGGTLLSGGAGALTGTLAGVLLLGVIQNLINQVGGLSSSYQAVVSGAFLIVVVLVQTYLSRRQRLPGEG